MGDDAFCRVIELFSVSMLLFLIMIEIMTLFKSIYYREIEILKYTELKKKKVVVILTNDYVLLYQRNQIIAITYRGLRPIKFGGEGGASHLHLSHTDKCMTEV